MKRVVPATSLLALLCLCLSTGCAEEAPQDDATLRQMMTVQAEAWNRGDATAWSQDFAPDADFINIVGTVFQGHDEIQQRHAAIFGSIFKGSQTQVTVRKIVFITPEIAVVDALHEVTGHPGLPPGVQNTEPGKLRTQMKYVMKKSAGRWQIVAGHNTDVKPPPPGT